MIPRFFNAHVGQYAVITNYPLPVLITDIGMGCDGKPYIGVKTYDGMIEYGPSFYLDGSDRVNSGHEIVSIFDISKVFACQLTHMVRDHNKLIDKAVVNDPSLERYRVKA